MLSATEIAILHDRWTGEWHADLPQASRELCSDFLHTVLANHLANFNIWHAEDEARLPEASDHLVARAKRAIDRENQRRNDFAELCDTILLQYLQGRRFRTPKQSCTPKLQGLSSTGSQSSRSGSFTPPRKSTESMRLRATLSATESAITF